MSSVKKKVRLVTDREKLEILVEAIANHDILNEYLNIDKLNLVKKREITDGFMEALAEAVRYCAINDLRIDIADLGTFEPRIRGKRNAVNPQLHRKYIEEGCTKEEASEKAKMVLPKQKTLGFKPSDETKDELRNEF